MPESADTPLGEKINAEIDLSGPMSLSTYMRLCLTHPELGYYRKSDPLGAGGDFITAPEISQMFGEMIGFWIAATWQMLGSPAKIQLVELGPGRGTLMADALRAVKNLPGLLDAAQLTLLETSPALIKTQKQALSTYNPEWIAEIGDISIDGPPLIVIANEFFDALPIKQYQKANGQWFERLIGLREGKRTWGLSQTPLHEDHLPAALKDAGDNEIWESASTADTVMADIAQRVAGRRGALLAIDYGYDRTQTGDTLQAVTKHRYADPLANPGEADLTAHVDFEALAFSGRVGGGQAHPLINQTQFLAAMGIGPRADALMKANPAQAGNIRAALKRLTDGDAMGTLFKVLCISSNELAPYPFVEAG